MGDVKRINGMEDIIPARGGMGPGGIGEIPTARMGRLDYANNLEQARNLAKATDAERLAKEKAAGIVRQPQTRNKSIDETAAKYTNPDTMSSGAQRAQPHGTLEWIEKNMKKGGFVHKSAHYKKHAAGHMVHMDHIKKNFKGK